MKFRLSVITVILLLGSYGYSQESTFDLEECMNYAVEHEASSVNATLDEEIAALSVKETIGIGLPQINTSSNVQHSPDLPRFFSRYDPNGGFGVSDEDAQEIGI